MNFGRSEQQRCSHCRFMLLRGYKICGCSCRHEYEEKITKLLYQPRDNTYIGDVCKYCGDTRNERLAGTPPADPIVPNDRYFKW